jgi:peptidoglycan/LPS O-acetylase OafA/YrhL
MTKKGGQIVELGAIRGIAAVMVMIAHPLNMYRTPEWFYSLTYVFNGRGAVSLFFVLSGFVLTHSLAGRALSTPNLVAFYIKRVFRLYPAIWAASTLGMIYLMFVHWHVYSPDASDWFHKRFRLDRFNWVTILASFAGMTAYILPQLWSIFVELVASVLMPFIAYAAYNRKGLFRASTVVALVASFLIGDWIYYCLGMYLVDFFIGAGIAVIPAGLRAVLASPRFPAGPVAVLATGALIASQYLPVDYLSPIAAFYEAVMATILIALLVYSRLDCPPLRSAVARYLGDISYSVYLIHFAIGCIMMKALDALQNANGWPLSVEWKSVIIAALTVVVTLPLAHLCYQYIELPGIQLGKWFGQRAKVRLNEGFTLTTGSGAKGEVSSA